MKLLAFAAMIPVSLVAFADPPSTTGELQPQYFQVAWVGSGMHQQELQDASLVLELVSNHDGTACSFFFPPCNPEVYFHNMYNDPTAYGLTVCNGIVDAMSGLCLGYKTSSVNMTAIVEDGQNLQNTWCHELGHVIGAGHGDASLSYGCLHTYTDLYYHLHHITDHLQYP